MQFTDNSTYIRSLLDDIYERLRIVLSSRDLPNQLLEYFAAVQTKYQAEKLDIGYNIDQQPSQPTNPFHKLSLKILHSNPCSNTIIPAGQAKESPEVQQRLKTEHYEQGQLLIKQNTMFLTKPKPLLRASSVTKHTKLPALLPKLPKK